MVTPSSNYNPLSSKSDKPQDKSKEPTPMENLAKNTFSNPQTADSDLEDRSVKEVDSDSEYYSADEIHDLAVDIFNFEEFEGPEMEELPAEENLNLLEEPEMEFTEEDGDLIEAEEGDLVEEDEGDLDVHIISESFSTPPPEEVVALHNADDLNLILLYLIFGSKITRTDSHEQANVIVDRNNNIFIKHDECKFDESHLKVISEDKNIEPEEFKIYALNTAQWEKFITHFSKTVEEILKKTETNKKTPQKTKENDKNRVRIENKQADIQKQKPQKLYVKYRRNKTVDRFALEEQRNQEVLEVEHRKKEKEIAKIKKGREIERKFEKHEELKREGLREDKQRRQRKELG